jgi:ATP-binding cassette subfamily B protein
LERRPRWRWDDVRASIFARVQDFSLREVGHFGAPSLITRTTNDVQQVQMLVLMTFTMMVAAPIMGVGGIIMALRQDVPLSSMLLVIVPALIGLIALIVARMRPLFRAMQERIDTVNQVLREQITGIRVIRAFVRDEHERARFRGANDELTDVSLRVGQLMALMFPTVMLVVNAASGAVVQWSPHRRGRDADWRSDRVLSYHAAAMLVMMPTPMFVAAQAGWRGGPRRSRRVTRLGESGDPGDRRGAPSQRRRLRYLGPSGFSAARSGGLPVRPRPSSYWQRRRR